MKEVWRLDKATVRDVYEALREKRSIAYTTVMTMMKILEDKGYLKRSQVDRAYVYRPASPRQQVVGAMVRDFVDRVFDGAAGGLLLHLAKDSRLSKEDRQRIKLVIQETEKPAREQETEKPAREQETEKPAREQDAEKPRRKTEED